MSHVRGLVLPRHAQRWLALTNEGEEAGSGLAASPYAMPGFFVGWIAVGLVMAVLLVARGHDPRSTLALGAGLGPLMAVVLSDAFRRREAPEPVVFEPGFDHGGPLDVLIVVEGDRADVVSLMPTLEAVRSEIGTVTLALTVEDEHPRGHLDGRALATGRCTLAGASAHLATFGPQVALWPGPTEDVVERFRARHRRSLVLWAVAGPESGSTGVG